MAISIAFLRKRTWSLGGMITVLVIMATYHLLVIWSALGFGVSTAALVEIIVTLILEGLAVAYLLQLRVRRLFRVESVAEHPAEGSLELEATLEQDKISSFLKTRGYKTEVRDKRLTAVGGKGYTLRSSIVLILLTIVFWPVAWIYYRRLKKSLVEAEMTDGGIVIRTTGRRAYADVIEMLQNVSSYSQRG